MINLQGVKTEKCNVKVTKEELMGGAEDNLDLSDLYILSRNILYKQMKLPVYAYIKKGQWFMEEEVGYGSHSFDKEVYIRDLTKRDEEVLSVIKSMYNLQKEKL